MHYLSTGLKRLLFEGVDVVHEIREVEWNGEEVCGLCLEPVSPRNHLHSALGVSHC